MKFKNSVSCLILCSFVFSISDNNIYARSRSRKRPKISYANKLNGRASSSDWSNSQNQTGKADKSKDMIENLNRFMSPNYDHKLLYGKSYPLQNFLNYKTYKRYSDYGSEKDLNEQLCFGPYMRMIGIIAGSGGSNVDERAEGSIKCVPVLKKTNYNFSLVEATDEQIEKAVKSSNNTAMVSNDRRMIYITRSGAPITTMLFKNEKYLNIDKHAKDITDAVEAAKSACSGLRSDMTKLNEEFGIGVSLTSGLGMALSGTSTGLGVMNIMKTNDTEMMLNTQSGIAKKQAQFLKDEEKKDKDRKENDKVNFKHNLNDDLDDENGVSNPGEVNATIADKFDNDTKNQTETDFDKFEKDIEEELKENYEGIRKNLLDVFTHYLGEKFSKNKQSPEFKHYVDRFFTGNKFDACNGQQGDDCKKELCELINKNDTEKCEKVDLEELNNKIKNSRGDLGSFTIERMYSYYKGPDRDKVGADYDALQTFKRQKSLATGLKSKSDKYRDTYNNMSEQIAENSKTSKTLDIAQAALSGASAISSGIAIGLSVSALNRVKGAIDNVKSCNKAVKDLKIVFGKYKAEEDENEDVEGDKE